jgi:imidazolonepropionase-like amidohydrolase
MQLQKTMLAGLLAFGAAALTVACTSTGGAQTRSTATVFEGARLITGDGSTPVDNAVFIVENHRFTQVGRAGEVQVPADATRVSLAGKTVMPAFVDLHSHVGFENATTATEEKENYTRENLIDHMERYAYTGHALTTSLGSDLPDEFVWQVRDDSRADTFMAARFFTVGRGLAWPGTGPVELSRNDTAYPIVSTWQARLAVRELAARKVPFIKLWLEDRGGYELPANTTKRDQLIAEHGVPHAGRPYQLTPEIYRAAIDEAKKHQIRTLAHVKTREDLKDMLRAGIDGWTHPIADMPADDELIALLKARPNLWYIPAITPAGSGGSAPRAAGQRPAWMTDPLLGAIKCPAYLEKWGQSFEKSGRVPPPTGGLGVENVAAFRKAGVRIVLGSHDAGGNRVIGWGTHMELEAFVNWVGMTTREAIVSATSLAAEALGVQNDLGTVAPGKSADFIVLDANPLDDITNTRRISQVYLHGAQLDRPALKAKWQAACTTASQVRTN